ncbi:MAG TPA: hypothetical protein VMX18_00545 [Candidatus Bipolaricaulota bacterium]|nr:hypothetical protein [Candidatus Bipolaricaulota bacterium]
MWVFLAILGYLFFSIGNIIDKLVLTKIKRATEYALSVGVFGSLGLLFVFFGFVWPSEPIILLGILVGALYIFALIPYYKAIQLGQASRVASFIGGLIPVVVLILTTLSGLELLTTRQYFAFFLILGGSFLIFYHLPRGKKSKTSILWALLSATALGCFYFLSKFIFLETGFVSGFVIMRVGGILASVSLMFFPHVLSDILKDYKNRRRETTKDKAFLVLLAQSLAAAGFVSVSYAVAIGKVALVNAMAGAQYVFLLILAVLLAKKFPQLKEQVGKEVVIQKIIAIVIIITGLILII